jgi:hypothetical protein
MREEWKTIECAPHYEVSNYGRVRYVGDHPNGVYGHVRKVNITWDGYDHVRFRVDGKYVYRRTHRLVYQAFKGSIPNGYVINHIDGEKLNNHIDNLEAVTIAENCRHAIKLGLQKGRRGEKCNWAKLTEKDVKEIRKLLQDGRLLQKEIGAIYGVTKSQISKIKLNQRWQHIK